MAPVDAIVDDETLRDGSATEFAAGARCDREAGCGKRVADVFPRLASIGVRERDGSAAGGVLGTQRVPGLGVWGGYDEDEDDAMTGEAPAMRARGGWNFAADAVGDSVGTRPGSMPALIPATFTVRALDVGSRVGRVPRCRGVDDSLGVCGASLGRDRRPDDTTRGAMKA